MIVKKIKLSDLLVNKDNDRHGELMDESTAIAWLLTHRANHMRNLTKDITQSGEIYEPPLVRFERDKYVVYDGNRRATALKLLADPKRAVSADWIKFFTEQRSKWNGSFPVEVFARIENDPERLDEILYRRHNGQQAGVGQSQWDAEAKSNFQKRTGKNTKIDIAEEIEKLLRANDRLSEEEKIPRSNMKRLLSAEQFRNRVGISVEKNKLKFTHRDDAVLKALERVAKDLVYKKITLDDIWDNEAKRKYLDDLDRSNFLPSIDDTLCKTKSPERPTSEPSPEELKPNPKEPSTKSSAVKRKHLIRNIDYGLQQQHHNRRALDILSELQHRLQFDKHDNAIAVLFRVLVELSTEIYIGQERVPDVHTNDKLAKRFLKSIDHMLNNGSLEKDYYASIKKFENSEALFSAKTLHQYVHNDYFFPSDHHLKSMWDTIEKYVMICLKV